MGKIRKSDIGAEMKHLESQGKKLQKSGKRQWVDYNRQMDTLTDRYISEAKDINYADRQNINNETAHEFTEQLWRSMGKTRIFGGFGKPLDNIPISQDPTWEEIGPGRYRKIILKENTYVSTN